MRTRSTALLALVVSTALIAAAACSGGHHGGGSGTPTPTPGAPTGVVAVPGFHQLAISWSAVGGATDYRVFVSTAPITSDSAGTPTGTNLLHYTAPGLNNWTTYHVRVQADDNGRLGPLSAEVTAQPTAGWIVASRTSGGTPSLVWLHSDEPNQILDSIAGASIPFQPAVEPTVLAFGVGAGDNYTAVGWASGSGGHQTVAQQTGHTYRGVIIAATPPRLIFFDTTGAGTGNFVSYARDGSDPRTLASGCTYVSSFGTPNGAAIECDAGATKKWWVTADGLTAASFSTTGILLPNDIGNGYVYFHDGGAKKLFAEPLTGGTPAAIGGGTVDTTLFAVGAGRILLQAQGGGGYTLATFDPNGTNQASVSLNQTNPFQAGPPSADGQAALVYDNNTSKELLVKLAIGASPVDFSGGGGTDADALFLPDGRVAELVDAADWKVLGYPTGTPEQTFSSTSTFVVAAPPHLHYLPMNDNVADLDVFDVDTGTITTLTANWGNLAASNDDGRVTWLQAGGSVQSALGDGSDAQTVDPGPSTSLVSIGTAPDGRGFVDFDVGGRFRIVSLSSATALVVASSGTASYDSGLWMP